MTYQSEAALIAMLKSKNNVFIYGKGVVGSCFVNRLRCIENRFDGDTDVRGFIDRQSEITLYMGLPVLSFDDFMKKWGAKMHI